MTAKTSLQKSVKSILLRAAWSISGGCLSLLLLNNFNLIHFGGDASQNYYSWVIGVFVLASLTFLLLSFIFKALHIPVLIRKPSVSSVLSLALSVSFLAIHGLALYSNGFIVEFPYKLSVAALIVIGASYATWVCFSLLFKALLKFIQFIQFTKEEKLIIAGFTAMSVTTTVVFNFLTSILYSSDKVFSLDTGNQLSQGIINNTHTVYTGVRHIGESVITSPIGALTAPLNSLFWFIPNGQHLIIMAVFSLLIALSSVLIVRMLPVNGRLLRISFHALYLLSSPVLLFSSMFEQYVPSVFFIIACIFFLWTSQKKRLSVNYSAIPSKFHIRIAASLLVFSGMGILTSLAGVVLFVQKNFKATLINMTLITAILSIFILTSGQILTVVFGYQEYNRLHAFMGLGFAERINVYSHFVINTFVNVSMSFQEVSYGSGIGVVDPEYLTSTFSFPGAILFSAVAAGIIMGIRKGHFIFYAAALWLALSFVVLAAIGWGAANNESTLYTYYFSFAFVIGLFYFIVHILSCIGKKLGISKGVVKIAILCLVILISTASIVQYARIVKFGANYYPIDVRSFVKNASTPN